MDVQDPSSPRPAASPLVVDLVRPPFWTSGLIFFLGVTGMVSANLVATVAELFAAAAPTEAMGPPLTLLAAAVILVGVVFGRRLVVFLRPLPPIRFADDHVSLPVSTESLRARRVPYGDILTIAVRGELTRGLLVLETKRHLIVYAFGAFKDADGPRQVIDELNRRIGSLPQGAAIVQRAEHRQALAEEAMARRPWATQAIVGVLVVIFANQYLAGAFDKVLGLVAWGANTPALVRNGEYFRLLAANFLHGTMLHLMFNVVALYLVGGLLERLLGWVRFTAVYLSSGIAAMVASAFFLGGAQSVGASGAVFGILGGLAVVNWRYRTEVPLGFRQPLLWWVMIMGLNAALPVLIPLVTMARVDVAAHVAGFVFGALLTATLIEGSKRLKIGAPASPALWAATFGLIAVHLLALGQAVLYVARFDSDKRLEVSRLLVEDPDIDGNGLNEVAWGLVTDPALTTEGLTVARDAAARAVRLVPAESTFVDTFATAEYRLGNLDKAVELERGILEGGGDLLAASPVGRLLTELFLGGREVSVSAGSPFYASQLYRFLLARVAHAGPVLPASMPPPALTLVLDPAATKGDAAPVLRVARPPGAAPALTVYALAKRGVEPLGLVRVCATSDQDLALPVDAVAALAQKRVVVEPALVRPGCVDELSAAAAVRFWPYDKQVDLLP